MDWIYKVDWMTNVCVAIKNFIYPAQLKERIHEYGLVEEGSECNILEYYRKGSLIIAPFRGRDHKHSVLVISPRSLCITAKFSGSKIWRLWENYFAVITEASPMVKNISVYTTMSSKRFQKVKNVVLNSPCSFSLIQKILSCERHKTIYIMEDYRICVASVVSSNIQQEWTSQDKILQGFICEKTRSLFTCLSNSKISVYSLDSAGQINSLKYQIAFESEFGIAYLENRELTLITCERRAYEIGYAESDEENDLNIYVSRFRLDLDDYEACQRDFLLAEIPDCEYKFEFIKGNKALVCLSDQKPVLILSVSTGEVLFKHFIIGNVVKVDPKEEAIFISNESSLQRLNLDTYIPN